MSEGGFRDRIENQFSEAREAEKRYSRDEIGRGEALEFIREGFGPTVSIYIESRTGGRFVHFSDEEFRRLEYAMNTWLELFGLWHGVELELDYTVREAAKLLIDTHSARDAAELLIEKRRARQ